MNFSDRTLTILSNFASINDNIRIMPGTKITTRSPQKEVFAVATVVEEIPQRIGLYRLSQFLATMALIPDRILEFVDDTILKIQSKDASTVVQYQMTPDDLLTYMDKEIRDFDGVIEVDLSEARLQEIKKAASALNADHLAFRAEDGKLYIKVYDPEDGTSNEYSILVGDADLSASFTLVFAIEHLKFVKGDYKAIIASKGVGRFEAASGDLTYWVAMKSKYSSFTESE